jgi:hypothetical protein
VLFHDTDGTTSLKVVSLEGATEYTTGKVAIVTGTVGTAQAQLWSIGGTVQFGGYKDAAGDSVQLGSVTRIALRSSSPSGVQIVETDGESDLILLSRNSELALTSNSSPILQIKAASGTASFTAVLYGTENVP